jgi:GTP pyrophosphokinase
MVLTERFEEALRYAHQLHAGQMRKASEVPYVAHLLGVAALVIEDGGDEDEAIAALLHDAVEDQGGAETRQEIRRRFGDRVTAIVDACSDAETMPKPPWRERKERFIASVPYLSDGAVRVTAADKLHNARSLLRQYRQSGELVWERFRGGREGTLWYYREVLDALARRSDGELVEELERVVAELEELARTA